MTLLMIIGTMTVMAALTAKTRISLIVDRHP